MSVRGGADGWYSPDRLVSLLRRYHQIQGILEGTPPAPPDDDEVQLGNNSGGGGHGDSSAHEQMLAIYCDLRAGLRALDPLTRDVIYRAYCCGFTDHEIMLHTAGSTWRIRRQRAEGLWQMARELGWRGSAKPARQSDERTRRRGIMRQVVALSMGTCAAIGYPLSACLVCHGLYNAAGTHIGEMVVALPTDDMRDMDLEFMPAPLRVVPLGTRLELTPAA